MFAAFRRGDVEAMGDLTHPDAEFVNPEYAIESGTRHGRDEIGRAVRRLLEFFDAVEVESMDRTPDGRILVAVARAHATVSPAAAGSSARTATIFTVREGLLVALRVVPHARRGVGRAARHAECLSAPVGAP